MYAARTIVDLASELEGILFGLLAVNASLKGHIKEAESCGRCFPPANCFLGCPQASLTHVSAVLAAPAAPLPKKVDTLSVEVGSIRSTETSREVVKKVMERVSPTLNARAYDIKPISWVERLYARRLWLKRKNDCQRKVRGNSRQAGPKG